MIAKDFPAYTRKILRDHGRAVGYPVEIDVNDRLVVVVGGGAIALRRVRRLVESGARVTVVAPEILDGLAELPVTVRRRRYRDGDLAGAWLAHAATDDPAVNAAVAAEAERARIWCVRAGGRPGPAGRPGPGGRPGTVALVGGGPGDPGLITVRGRRLLAEADVVVADRLAPSGLLDELDPDVEIVLAGKSPGAHTMAQDQINALIVDRALAGHRVVRLKGGDPFVFGRGGEEALACVRAGVPFTVVPGVTSAVAVPAYAGIPVTHRGITQDFAVVSAHLDPSQPGTSVDWESLATGPGTLVLLMAFAHLDAISSELIKRGRDGATPVAVIRDGTMETQQVLTSTLERVAADAADANIRPPAVVVVGDVVRLRERLAGRAGDTR